MREPRVEIKAATFFSALGKVDTARTEVVYTQPRTWHNRSGHEPVLKTTINVRKKM